MRSLLAVVPLLSACTLVFPAAGSGSGGSRGGTTPPATASLPPLSPLEQCRFSCAGCCTPSGSCLAGTANEGCGSGGLDCSVCPDTSRCESAAGGGQCASCNGFNCAGCCTGEGTCLAGTANDACGMGGQTCVECTGTAACDPLGLGGGACR